MKASLLAALNDNERLLIAETEPKALAVLDEDEVVQLHTRVRRARGKYVGKYRRGASARVAEAGGRGKARPQNRRAALKAEAFEEALSRVSRRLAVLAKASADALKAERLATARAGKQGRKPAADAGSGAQKGKSTKAGRGGDSSGTGDRSLRSPRTEKNRAGAKASGARRQAKKDNR